MANKERLLELTWKIEQGFQGTDDDPSTPLSRAVNRLFRVKKWQPFSHISLCFFGDLAPRMPQNSPLRWLGVFVWSAGERLLFFPGFATSPIGIRHFLGESRQAVVDDPAFTVDHVTLDPDRTHSHVTSQSRGHKPSLGRTSPLGEGRILWVGMSVARETGLRELKRETLVIAHVPASKSQRRADAFMQRADAFMQARDGAEFSCVPLHPEARMRFPEGFLHFAFIVGPMGFPDYDGDNLAFPFGPPLLPEPSSNALERLPLYTTRLSLGSVLDIQIVSMWLPGSLGSPYILAWPTS
jgi:hypothetical protein